MNIAEILKNVPKGTNLYSPIYGDVIFEEIRCGFIRVSTNHIMREFHSDGKFYANGECMLFPSRKNRDWNTFKKFDITNLKPFDKVLVRDKDGGRWKAGLYSNYKGNIADFPYECIGSFYVQCIPYNDDTKHLIGTTEDCPEYYKTW